MQLKTLILAAGKGTRMKSNLPKVLHKLNQKALIDYSLDLSALVSDLKPIVVIGHKAELVKEYIKGRAVYVYQKQQLGTGDAVKAAFSEINEADDVLITCADTPLIKKETIAGLIDAYSQNDAAVLISQTEEPFGYGRIILDDKDRFLKIVEEKDADSEEKKVTFINAGIYIVKGHNLKKYINKLETNNSQGEFYLTDIFSLMVKDGLKVAVSKAEFSEILGVNSQVQLEQAREIVQNRINLKHMENGVTIINPKTVYIDEDSIIANDVMIYPETYISKSDISSGCVIGPNTTINDSKIEENVNIKYSYIESSHVDSNTTIGPFSHLRPGALIGKNAKIGNFVEIKNSSLGDGSKASHLAYVGDADVGKNVNIGCGVIFVNYDGAKKYRSVVKDGAFVGSNSNIVAPVILNEQAYVACGSTITCEVPKGALCIERTKPKIVEGWVEKRKIFDKNR